ncbi:MAG: type II secretion system F family protein, partial [Eubacterium sp.]|nr:type II secretion system F family protein [Eubacterium sp.]
MAKFKYVITDKYGKEKKGTMDALSVEAATQQLKGDGSIVLSINETADLSGLNITIGNPVKKKDITIFCRQFYSILMAGVTVIDGLRMVQEQTQNKYLRTSLFNV